MKSKLTFVPKFLLVFTLVFSLASCHTSFDFRGEKGDGNVITQTRSIAEKFEKIEVNSGLDLIVTQNDSTSVTVEIDENLQSYITTKVVNGVLIVSTDGQFNATNNVVIRVNLPIISGLKSTSGSTIKSNNTLKTTSLKLESTSGSEIQLDVEADYISMESTSGSDIEVTGKALKVETSSTSGSDINAGKLIANEVFSQSSSGSSTKVHPVLSLKGTATSGSEIEYVNVPKKLEKEENSGGSVSKY
ncbi:head GIN domain-containing protein [Flavobacterium antarcticum]|uniref:head GIN domain-containing protein n=1 Tax=Flavobacterium antarcticum TaxID=271155 RepID=UPI0003B31E2E|nr:head GIN domain-containing protein [Flavobacterium antarcticum]